MGFELVGDDEIAYRKAQPPSALEKVKAHYDNLDLARQKERERIAAYEEKWTSSTKIKKESAI